MVWPVFSIHLHGILGLNTLSKSFFLVSNQNSGESRVSEPVRYQESLKLQGTERIVRDGVHVKGFILLYL